MRDRELLSRDRELLRRDREVKSRSRVVKSRSRGLSRDRELLSRDRELLSRDRKYRGVPYEPLYVPFFLSEVFKSHVQYYVQMLMSSNHLPRSIFVQHIKAQRHLSERSILIRDRLRRVSRWRPRFLPSNSAPTCLVICFTISDDPSWYHRVEIHYAAGTVMQYRVKNISWRSRAWFCL